MPFELRSTRVFQFFLLDSPAAQLDHAVNAGRIASLLVHTPVLIAVISR